jgi:CheY-like chemotaxis protein
MHMMLRRTIGEHIELEYAFAPDLWLVEMDQTQVERVIVNLVVNARDALPDGGTIAVEAANRTLKEPEVNRSNGEQPGEYVVLAVRDTGLGMSQEVKDHLFEPFFTTKEVGRGTGLGLATVHGVVTQAGGWIRVRSTQGQGTVFEVYLPRTEKKTLPALQPEVRQHSRRGTETILVVEDDEAVRELACRVLKKQGYALLQAPDGQQARKVIDSHPEPIDLLLTDVVMPGIDGKALADQMAGTRKGLKILFMSGYADETLAHHGVLDPGIAFLPKPFQPPELRRKVREVLDS